MLLDPLRRYARWLHTRWPAGTVERLPEIGPEGATALRGVYVAGDLSGVPLLKLAADGGARAVRAIVADPTFAAERARCGPDVAELAIVGAGVAGMAAALEARRAGLRTVVYEGERPFATLVDFPRGKPIYTYPLAFRPAGELTFRAEVKEDLVEEVRAQTRDVPVTPGRVRAVRRRTGRLELELEGGEAAAALRVLVAIGRSGDFRRLGVPGEDLGHVFHRLHDPKDHAGARVLVVGGGDSAVETAIALVQCGASVVLAHRGEALTRPKPANAEALARLLDDPGADVQVERPVSERVTAAAGPFLEEGRRPGSLRLALRTRVREIREREVVLESPTGAETVAADVVFAMVGRQAPVEFFRRSGLRLRGEWTRRSVAAMAVFLLFCVALYDWKSGGVLDTLSQRARAFPYALQDWVASPAPGSLARVLWVSAASPSFYYTLAYSILVVGFGVRRVRRTRTPYVRVQTLVLAAVQVLPLFLLPEILLPWLDGRGWLPPPLADALFPRVDYGHGREFWRAYGLVLAWPLNVYNVFTERPLPWWLLIAFLQTFVLIPLAIRRWGKGVYCGWICSCGALAETLGDAHRQKMPHGPGWNRLNLAGQGILAVAFVLLALRIVSWAIPGRGPLDAAFAAALSGGPLSWKWTVDVFLAGVVGYGTYFWLSGRVWCRFFCPLAALMHVYARFSSFRILADKKKCISCNVCTSVCHQGIDVMAFANKGIPMADPQCVRCSACVSSCPTEVLAFGRVSGRTGQVISVDRLRASLPR